MLSQVIDPNLLQNRTGRSKPVAELSKKAIFINDFSFTRHESSSGKLSMYLLTASHGYTQTVSSVVSGNANAVLSVLAALRLVQF